MRSGQPILGAFTPHPTGKDGRFAIRGVPNVPLTIEAWIAASPDVHGQVDAEPGETDVRMVLDQKLAGARE